MMLSILIIFRVRHFFPVQIWANAGQYSYLYYISGTPSPTPENAFKLKFKKGDFRGAQSVEKGLLG